MRHVIVHGGGLISPCRKDETCDVLPHKTTAKCSWGLAVVPMLLAKLQRSSNKKVVHVVLFVMLPKTMDLEKRRIENHTPSLQRLEAYSISHIKRVDYSEDEKISSFLQVKNIGEQSNWKLALPIAIIFWTNNNNNVYLRTDSIPINFTKYEMNASFPRPIF